MLPCYTPGLCKAKVTSKRHSRGSYDLISPAAKSVLIGLLENDIAVYEAGLGIHAEQRARFPEFDAELRRFTKQAQSMNEATKTHRGPARYLSSVT